MWRVGRGLRIFGWTVTVILMVGWLMSLVGLFIAESADGRITGVTFAIFFGAAAVYLFASVIRPFMEDRGDHLFVQNTYRRHEIAWGDIVKIKPSYWGLEIERRVGPTVTARAVQKSRWASYRNWETRADEVIHELARLAQARGGGRSVESIMPSARERAALSRSARTAMIFGLGVLVVWIRVRTSL